MMIRFRRRLPRWYLGVAVIIGLAFGVELAHQFGVRSVNFDPATAWPNEVAASTESVDGAFDEVEAIQGRVVGIADGDTLTLLVDRTQHRIRLAEIDTPESGQPWGNRARQALAERVFQETVEVEVVDTDRYGRKVGKIWLGDRDINRELVRQGHAWVYRQYMEDESLLEDETAAREAHRGLWGLSDPVPPWEWRGGSRTGSKPAASFQCGSKTYCRQMASCEEARFYLNECGLTRLDGDSDGVPCEVLCR